jgi:hypothetical protein
MRTSADLLHYTRPLSSPKPPVEVTLSEGGFMVTANGNFTPIDALVEGTGVLVEGTAAVFVGILYTCVLRDNLLIFLVFS